MELESEGCQDGTLGRFSSSEIDVLSCFFSAKYERLKSKYLRQYCLYSLAAEGVNLAREYPQWVFEDYASKDLPHQESE